MTVLSQWHSTALHTCLQAYAHTIPLLSSRYAQNTNELLIKQILSFFSHNLAPLIHMFFGTVIMWRGLTLWIILEAHLIGFNPSIFSLGYFWYQHILPNSLSLVLCSSSNGLVGVLQSCLSSRFNDHLSHHPGKLCRNRWTADLILSWEAWTTDF